MDIEHPKQQIMPCFDANGDGEQVKQNIAAAKEINPPPPRIVTHVFAEHNKPAQAEKCQKAAVKYRDRDKVPAGTFAAAGGNENRAEAGSQGTAGSTGTV